MRMKKSCANLGRSGTGTGVQLNVLEHYLTTEGWRPKKVNLFMLAMTGALLPGNDLLDNYWYGSESSAKAEGLTSPNRSEYEKSGIFQIQALRQFLIQRSNLVRFVYFNIDS